MAAGYLPPRETRRAITWWLWTSKSCVLAILATIRCSHLPEGVEPAVQGVFHRCWLPCNVLQLEGPPAAFVQHSWTSKLTWLLRWHKWHQVAKVIIGFSKKMHAKFFFCLSLHLTMCFFILHHGFMFWIAPRRLWWALLSTLLTIMASPSAKPTWFFGAHLNRLANWKGPRIRNYLSVPHKGYTHKRFCDGPIKASSRTLPHESPWIP